LDNGISGWAGAIAWESVHIGATIIQYPSFSNTKMVDSLTNRIICYPYMKRCKFCGKKHQNKTFCSVQCTGKWLTTTPEGRKRFYTAERARKIGLSKIQMHKDNPQLAERLRQRQLEHNCMKDAEVRRKVSVAHKRSGWKPPIRGGNGTGPTPAEKVLLEAFWPHAKNNFPIKTSQKSGTGYPTCYKVDLGFPELKLAIEADGRSHSVWGRKALDAKKTNFLTALGWTVLRFTNQRILEDTQNVKEEVRSIILRLKGTPT
jgi:very-short-patch-repair endonuclease